MRNLESFLEKTQAAELARLVANFEKTGFKMRVNERGGIFGIRRGKRAEIKRAFDKTTELEATKTKMLKGQKAYYSDKFFKLVGEGIYERETLRLVDILSA